MRSLIGAAVTFALAGCSVTLQECRQSVGFKLELIRKDENTCAADPKAMPACIAGIRVLSSCRI